MNHRHASQIQIIDTNHRHDSFVQRTYLCIDRLKTLVSRSLTRTRLYLITCKVDNSCKFVLNDQDSN